MEITVAMVKSLRETTGAGMMDCKKALNETNGDMDAAIEYLRKKGVATAAKKASRIAAEGLVTVAISDDQKTGAIVEVNSETDFVAKNAMFQEFVADVAAQALQSPTTDMEQFMAQAWVKDASKTVQDALVEKVAVISENLQIRRVAKVESPSYVASYIHGGGRIGVLVNVKADVLNDAVKSAAKLVAMQVAAMNPQYNTRADVDPEYLAKERQVLRDQALEENAKSDRPKPEAVVDKMVEGRLSKEMQEICLADQVFAVGGDGKQTVSAYLAQAAKEAGTPIEILGFVRYETGEGIEKRQENFAEEVAKQMGM